MDEVTTYEMVKRSLDMVLKIIDSIQIASMILAVVLGAADSDSINYFILTKIAAAAFVITFLGLSRLKKIIMWANYGKRCYNKISVQRGR